MAIVIFTSPSRVPPSCGWCERKWAKAGSGLCELTLAQRHVDNQTSSPLQGGSGWPGSAQVLFPDVEGAAAPLGVPGWGGEVEGRARAPLAPWRLWEEPQTASPSGDSSVSVVQLGLGSLEKPGHRQGPWRPSGLGKFGPLWRKLWLLKLFSL